MYGTHVWNRVLEPDNLCSWQTEIKVRFGKRNKSLDHSKLKLWLQAGTYMYNVTWSVFGCYIASRKVS